MNYEGLKEKYSNVASWAIWNTKNISDTSIIEDNVEDLNTGYVFVGLNISRDIPGEWRNFHSRHQGSSDYKLARDLNDSIYRGSYMTDILKNTNEPNSRKLEIGKKLKNEREYFTPHIEFFIKEMRDIGGVKKLFLFGSDTYKIFESFDELSIFNFELLPHYSSRQNNEVGYLLTRMSEEIWKGEY